MGKMGRRGGGKLSLAFRAGEPYNVPCIAVAWRADEAAAAGAAAAKGGGPHSAPPKEGRGAGGKDR